MLLILSISVPTSLFIFGMVLFYIYNVIKNRNNIFEKGTLLAKIDLSNRKIYTYDSQFNKTIPRNFILYKSKAKWVSIDDVLLNYQGQMFERKFRAMLVDMQSGKPFVQSEFELKTIMGRSHTHDIVVTMFTIEDSSDIGMTFQWKLQKKEERNKEFSFEPSSKTEIAEINFKYKGFIAFQLKTNIPNVTKEFVYQLQKIINFKNKFYFITNGVLVIVIADKKAAKLKKRIVNLTDIMNHKGSILGLNRMYNGTSFTVAKDVTSPKRINSVLQLLHFNINLSLRTGKSFTNRNTTEFNFDEYKVVTQALKRFREAIKTKDINSRKIKVENYKTQRKIMSYTFPEIEGISQEINSIILRDPANVESLMNLYAEMVSINGLIKEPVLIDISNDWLFENYEFMKYKKAIYVINYNPFSEVNTEDIVKKLTNKKFIFAIRLKSFDEHITTILKKTEPQFIVIDEALSNVEKPENYIQLLSIKTLAEKAGIRIIYENPSSNVDDSMAEVLGIKYVYRL